MRVNFFAEYPADGELTQASRLDFPATIYVAADSVPAYREYRAELAAIDESLETAYWPILEDSYWVSPFADAEELDALFEATADLEDPVMLDLELPVGRPRLFVRNLGDFRANKRRIQRFVRDADAEIRAAEYPPVPVLRRLFGVLGVRFRSAGLDHTRCPMFYTSLLPDWLVSRTVRNVEAMVQSEARVAVGLGTIATGVFEDEAILSPADLERDLQRMADAGADEVIVFRLGGLDDEYCDVIERFVD